MSVVSCAMRLLAIAIAGTGLLAVSPGMAGASSTGLYVTSENGVAVPVRSAVGLTISLDQGSCVIASQGELETNGRPKDKFVMQGAETYRCQNGDEIRGGVKTITIDESGGTVITMVAHTELESADGLCIYDLKRLDATTTVPGSLNSSTRVTGTLKPGAKNASSCRTSTAVEGTRFFEPDYELEVRPRHY